MKAYVYVARRLLLWPGVVLGIVTMTFVILHATPGDSLVARSAIRGGVDPAYIENMRRTYGLDKPLHEQYLRYLGNLLSGNLGLSMDVPGKTVDEVLFERLPATIELTLAALLFAIGIGVPLGIMSALHRNLPLDHAARLFSLSGVSMPSFWLGLILLIVFFYHLGILPSSGRLGILSDPPEGPTGLYTIDSLIRTDFALLGEALTHLALPAFTLSMPSLAMLARLTRSGMLDTLSKDYIRLAKSIGLAERTINYRLALKNTLIPTVTFIGVAVGSMLGGSIIIETVFSWPGVGRFAVTAMLSKDYFAVMGVVVMMGVIYSFSSLIVDLIYGILDPRIRYG